MEVKCNDGFNAILGDNLNEVYYTIMGIGTIIGVSTLGWSKTKQIFVAILKCNYRRFKFLVEKRISIEIESMWTNIIWVLDTRAIWVNSSRRSS